jgi:hypothetical protein
LHNTFAKLLTQTSIKKYSSKNGYAIILSEPVHGRQDIPGDPGSAAVWLMRAGISTTGITDADIAAWASWFDDGHARRRIAGARILITAPPRRSAWARAAPGEQRQTH